MGTSEYLSLITMIVSSLIIKQWRLGVGLSRGIKPMSRNRRFEINITREKGPGAGFSGLLVVVDNGGNGGIS